MITYFRLRGKSCARARALCNRGFSPTARALFYVLAYFAGLIELQQKADKFVWPQPPLRVQAV